MMDSSWQQIKDEIHDVTKQKKKDSKATEYKKKKIISDIKEGELGDELKSAPKQVKIIKTPWYKKLTNGLIKFLKKL